jgi:hypothetical protein
MAVFNKFDQFVLDLATKVHNLNADALKVMLTDTLPVRTNKVKADIAEIAAGNGYVTGGNVAAFNSGGDTAGLYKLILAPAEFTAAGGNFAQFRYAVLYNSTASGGPLVGFWDFGAEVNLTNGNVFIVGLDQVNGVLTLQ